MGSHNYSPSWKAIRWVLDISSSIFEVHEKYICSQEISGPIKSLLLARNSRTSVSKSLLNSPDLGIIHLPKSTFEHLLFTRQMSADPLVLYSKEKTSLKS